MASTTDHWRLGRRRRSAEESMVVRADPRQPMHHHELMSIQVQTAIIAAVTGLASGTLSSLFAPWVAWRIEKRRQLLDSRTRLVSEWRTGLAETEAISPLSDRSFLTESWYLSLRPHLEAKIRGRMEYTDNSEPIVVIGNLTNHRDPLAVDLSNEVERIANEWK